jgi:transposase InsO family protein
MFPVEKMCKVLRLSRSSYYSWKNREPSKREKENKMLEEMIVEIHLKSRGTYGSPRISRELQELGFSASKPRVARLMKSNGIQSKIRKKWKITTNSNHKYPIVPNKLNRNFTTETPNEVWVSDITYIATKEGWLYLTVVLDLWDRKIIGWALSKTMYAKDTVIPAWKMANDNRKINAPLIFHSDRGIQYACKEFTNYLDRNKLVTRSMSRKGDCWDNAVAESFFKTLKTELVYHQDYETISQAELAVFDYIETWYNRQRRHSALNGMTILEFEKLNYKKQAA